jgi:hypothetical protein
MVVYEIEKSGNLAVAIPTELTDLPEGQSWKGKGQVVIYKADGTPQTKALQNLRKMFPAWTDAAPYALEDIDPGQDAFEVVIVVENYTSPPSEEVPDPQPIPMAKIQWFNPLGGTTIMPEPMDRKQLTAKWGALWKATAPKPVEKTKSKQPELKSTSSGPPSRRKVGEVARISSADEVWKAFKKLNESKPESERLEENVLGEKFFEAQDEIAPGKNGNLSPQEWGLVADLIAV